MGVITVCERNRARMQAQLRTRWIRRLGAKTRGEVGDPDGHNVRMDVACGESAHLHDCAPILVWCWHRSRCDSVRETDQGATVQDCDT